MGVGVDIEEVARFKKYAKDEYALKRIFSQDEIIYCMPKKNYAMHLAARFAAKEAVWKALSGKNKKIFITDISVKNNNFGKPEIYLKGKKQKKIEISLSHTDNYAVAVAVINDENDNV